MTKKRKVRNLISLAFVFVLIVFFDVSSVWAGEVQWRYEGETLYLSGKGAIPDNEVESGGETVVGHKPWENLEIDRVVLEEGITSVGKYTFTNCFVRSVQFPKTLTTIKEDGFTYTRGLKKVDIPATVTQIESDAFSACPDLESVHINAPIRNLADGMFYECPKLVDVTLPNGLISIEHAAFLRCTALKEIRIPDSVTDIADEAFADCWKGLVLCGSAGSAAQKYALSHGLAFREIRGSAMLETPLITKVENTASGVKVTWGNVAGAARYRVYRKYGTSGWTRLTETSSTSYTDTTAMSGSRYTYTVRCVSADGRSFTSNYDTAGKSITYIAAPTISKVENVNGGVKVTWNKPTGAVNFRLYHKTGSGSWTKVGDTTGTTYTDKTAAGGTTYIYTVRCLSADAKTFTSSYNSTGKSITYVAAPVLTKISNTISGVTLTWSKSTGAAKYRVYRKNGTGSWTRLADTTATSYSDKTAVSGTTYSYTVRCLNVDGTAFTSSYNTTGLSIIRLSVPTPKSATNSAIGTVTVTWSAVTGAKGYYVYRKTGTASWAKVGTVTGGSTVSFKDTTAAKGKTYVYTVRAYNGSTMSDFNGTGVSVNVTR